MKPYKCPICEGRGMVPAGFYSGQGPTISLSDSAPEQCRSCAGRGVILCPHNDPPMGAPVAGDVPGGFVPFKWCPSELKMRGGCMSAEADPNMHVIYAAYLEGGEALLKVPWLNDGSSGIVDVVVS